LGEVVPIIQRFAVERRRAVRVPGADPQKLARDLAGQIKVCVSRY
jgi:hypothetical protein